MPELGYWAIRGLAQPIRLLLHYVGENYDEKLYPCGDAPKFERSEWLNARNSLGLDFPNLPYYVDGELRISQSNAILRHLARKHKMDGGNEREKVNIDVLENVSTDFRNSWVRLCYNPKFKESKADYLKNLPAMLTSLSKFLAKNGNKWLCGVNLTFPDFVVYELLDQHRQMEPDCLLKFPNLIAFCERFEALEPIKSYMKSSTFIKSPLNNKMAKFGNE